ncbi:hypothetical protein HDU93_002171 [Gonapodya sp. JEL0774]|nr:hypothetical protein HDU93_002171 [Gonapodya sp. JEL0774]
MEGGTGENDSLTPVEIQQREVNRAAEAGAKSPLYQRVVAGTLYYIDRDGKWFDKDGVLLNTTVSRQPMVAPTSQHNHTIATRPMTNGQNSSAGSSGTSGQRIVNVVPRPTTSSPPNARLNTTASTAAPTTAPTVRPSVATSTTVAAPPTSLPHSALLESSEQDKLRLAATKILQARMKNAALTQSTVAMTGVVVRGNAGGSAGMRVGGISDGPSTRPEGADRGALGDFRVNEAATLRGATRDENAGAEARIPPAAAAAVSSQLSAPISAPPVPAQPLPPSIPARISSIPFVLNGVQQTQINPATTATTPSIATTLQVASGLGVRAGTGLESVSGDRVAQSVGDGIAQGMIYRPTAVPPTSTRGTAPPSVSTPTVPNTPAAARTPPPTAPEVTLLHRTQLSIGAAGHRVGWPGAYDVGGATGLGGGKVYALGAVGEGDVAGALMTCQEIVSIGITGGAYRVIDHLTSHFNLLDSRARSLLDSTITAYKKAEARAPPPPHPPPPDPNLYPVPVAGDTGALARFVIPAPPYQRGFAPAAEIRFATPVGLGGGLGENADGKTVLLWSFKAGVIPPTVEWHEGIQVWCNGKRVSLEKRVRKPQTEPVQGAFLDTYRDRPCDLGPYLLPACGLNIVRVEWDQAFQYPAERMFDIEARWTAWLSKEAIQHVVNENALGVAEEVQMITNLLSPFIISTDGGDDDDVIMGENTLGKVPLIDPLSGGRIQHPVVGETCQHFQKPFDLASYLQVNARTPTAVEPKWHCPRCQRYTPPTKLRFSRFFAQLLTEIPTDVTEVTLSVHQDGVRWDTPAVGEVMEIDLDEGEELSPPAITHGVIGAPPAPVKEDNATLHVPIAIETSKEAELEPNGSCETVQNSGGGISTSTMPDIVMVLESTSHGDAIDVPVLMTTRSDVPLSSALALGSVDSLARETSENDRLVLNGSFVPNSLQTSASESGPRVYLDHPRKRTRKLELKVPEDLDKCKDIKEIVAMITGKPFMPLFRPPLAKTDSEERATGAWEPVWSKFEKQWENVQYIF